MTFLEILKDYLTEKNRIRRLDVERRREQNEFERKAKAEQSAIAKREREMKRKWVVVAKIEENWTKSRHGLEYSKGKVFYTLMENAVGERKILKAVDDDAYTDCYNESDDYKVRIRAWLEGANNLKGIMTFQQAEAQQIIDELKG